MQTTQTAQKTNLDPKRRELGRFQVDCELQKCEFLALRKGGYTDDITEFRARTAWIRECQCTVCANKRMTSAYWYSWLPGGQA